MRPALASLALLAAVAAPAFAGAQDTAPPPAPARGGPPPRLFIELDFSVGPGARSCPEASVLHGELARRIGYDPFDPGNGGTPAGRLTVKIGGWGGALTATYTYVDAAGKPVWPKPMTYSEEGTSEESCRGILRGIAAGFAWEFPIPDDAEPAPQPAPPPAPVCTPAVTVACTPGPEAPKPVASVVEAEKAPAPVTPAAAPVRWVPWVGAGVRADFGAAWGALFGVTLEGGVQRQEWGWGGWSLMGTLRWAPQQTAIGSPTTAASADVSSSLVAGSLAGCIYRAWPVSLAGCVVGELGEAQQSAGAPAPPFQRLHQTALFAGVGVGAHIKVPLSARLHVQIETEVVGVAKLAGSSYQWNYVAARSFGGAAGGLGADLEVSF